ncbi:MAG: M1 family peptidase [Chitinophagales bacterium]|nr:M1 family peptidase [Chitinophagales bacterium]
MNQRLCAGIFLLSLTIIVGCSTQRNIVTTGKNNDYQSKKSDSEYIEIPEDSIIITSPDYRGSATIVNDLVHTKLDVKFDWQKTYLYGKAWIILKPHFYATDSLTLDAKGFDIHKIELVKAGGNIPLQFSYDSMQIKIQLAKKYISGEQYTIYIDYTARPNELKVKGSAAINDARGLYFINADDKDPDKPRELWTQGESESNSAWFPTIDKPNMKMTTEVTMTVENGFVTLSNGLMTSSKDNGNGTHTDTWKLDLPYAPYLVMIAAGPFAIVKDHWKNMEVNYYVDKPFERYAREIFGNTPEMIEYFSNLLGVVYPWPKYSQIVAHDFVAGAEENVTATVHMEGLQQTPRERLDGDYEDYICHELFHQWFGDLVTCESWSNITLNESFADYAEYLWFEHKFGREEADLHRYESMQKYMHQALQNDDPLVRYFYDDKEDVFDRISYDKGGLILNMLRNYTGDEAFFKSLQVYLNDNRFQAAEVANLRLAFEKVTGKDLNWFFNQWYFSGGHPKLTISYQYDSISHQEEVTVEQTQNLKEGNPVFKLPVAIDVYENGKVTRHQAMFDQQKQTIFLPCDHEPELVNFDADKILVCEKIDKKSDSAFAMQMIKGPLFMDRLEALQHFSSDTLSPLYSEVIQHALNDKSWDIRTTAVERVKMKYMTSSTKNKLLEMAASDPKSLVRAAALEQMMLWNDNTTLPYFEKAISDSSYEVIGVALEALSKMDLDKALQFASTVENENEDAIQAAVANLYAMEGGSEKNNYFISAISNRTGFQKYAMLAQYGQFLGRMTQQPAVLDSGLNVLYAVATSASGAWWNRYAAVTSIGNIKTAMQEQASAWQIQLDKLTAGSQDYSNLKLRQEQLSSTISLVDVKLAAIKSAEKEERLRKIWGVN